MRIRGFAALATLGPALLLAGCDGSGSDAEDFTVEIKRPAAVVFAPLLAADVSEARMIFPGIGFQRSQPKDGEILYTIPGSGSFPATIRLRIEGKDGGAATVVHAFVKVPEVHATIGGQEMVVSERKVENQLQGLLKSTGRSLEMGSSAKTETSSLSTMLMAIAVATNEEQMARAIDLKAHPEKLTELLLAFSGFNDTPEPSVNGSTIRTVDPDAAQQQREFARTETEWKQQDALNEAAAPTTNVERPTHDYEY
jgi:hypothetical protein